ncbi:MAG: NFACT family protein [Firmicutes bacterium]|nr:NFACT family protein [Bacillota bacterium]
MAYDGIMAGIAARELSKLLTGGKIEKVQQPEPDEIILQIREDRGSRVKLLISSAPQGARVHITELPYENPEVAPAFCMLLRKHIQGGRINFVTQEETERIIQFEIETVNEMGYSVNKLLIAETMGKHSNIILCDMESGKIIDSIKRVSIDVNRVRQILPGLIYTAPPKQDKLDFWTLQPEDLESFEDWDAKSLGGRIQGFSPALANQLCESLRSEQIPSAVLALRDQLEAGNYRPHVYIAENGEPKDVHAAPLLSYAENLRTIEFDTVGQALDYFYSHRQDSSRTLQKAADLQRSVTALTDKQLLKKKRLLEDIQNADNADKFRIWGELITANLHLVKPGAKSVRVISYYDGSELEIPLDEKLSGAKNAQAYFKKYSKLKSSKKEKLAQLSECEDEIAYLESVQGLIPGASTSEELSLIQDELVEQGFMRRRKAAPGRQKKTKIKPRSFDLPGGYKVLVGRNNIENDFITLKMGQKTDWWFHTKDIHGSHCVLICEGKDPQQDTMWAAAAIAAWFSKGQQSQNVPVDYAQLKFVKKPAGAKPGKVIFTNNGTVYVDPKLP